MDSATLPDFLRRLRGLDEVFLLVVHFNEEGIIATVGRDEFEEQFSFALMSSDIFEGVVSLCDCFFEFIALYPDLGLWSVTLHLRYS